LVWPAARGRQELLRRPVVAELTGRRRSLRPGRHVAFRAGAKHRGQSRSNEQPRCSSGESARQRSHQPHTPCTPCTPSSLCAPCHTTCTPCTSTRRQRPVTANLDQHCGLLAARCGEAGTRRRQKPPGGVPECCLYRPRAKQRIGGGFRLCYALQFPTRSSPRRRGPVCTRPGVPLARECAGTSKERKRTWR
jgi:hypothetical protein